MAARYFRLLPPNPDDTNRWYLAGASDKDGTVIVTQSLIYGERVMLGEPLAVHIRHPGPSLDFTFADFGVPVLRKPLADALEAIAPDDLQRFTAFVDGEPSEFAVINITSKPMCLDERRSVIVRFASQHGLPDMVGKPMVVDHLTIHPDLVRNHHIFRVDGWPSAIIVSAEVKEVLQGASGVSFEVASPESD